MSWYQHSTTQKNKLKYQFKVPIRRKEERWENKNSCARYSLKQKHCLLISSHLNENNKMNFEIMYSFSTAARGYHYYRRYWQPEIIQRLYLFNEKNNHFDSFAIKMCDTRGSIFGHVPMEISRITTILLDRGTRIETTMRLTHYTISSCLGHPGNTLHGQSLDDAYTTK